MARLGIGCNLNTALSGQPPSASHAHNDGGTSLAAAVATAVADGASPTQAHVTAINTALTAQNSPHVQVSYDTTAVTTLSQFDAALKQARFAAQAAGLK